MEGRKRIVTCQVPSFVGTDRRVMVMYGFLMGMQCNGIGIA